MNNQCLLVLTISLFGLVGCNTLDSQDDPSYRVSNGSYDPYQQVDLPYVPSAAEYSYESTIDYQSPPIEEHVVTVPETYHVGVLRAPVSHQDRDKTWVSSQNPQGYTIEIAKSKKPSEVAKQLMQAPKKEHMAEIQSSQQGETYYQGFYGSYPTYEAAKQALDALPEGIKQKSGIKSWHDVQGSNTLPD